MDVLTGLATSLNGEGGDESMVELLEYLGAERYRQARKLRGQARNDGPQFARYLKRCAARLQKRAGDQASSEAKTEAAAVIAARALVLSQDLRDYPRLSRSNLHEFRLQVKHLRYILQMATDSETALVRALGEVKDKIGDWHDWEQLTELARDVAQNGSGRLVRQLTTVTTQKYAEALRVAEQLRRQHFARLPTAGKVRAIGRSAPAEVANSLLAA
jgi:CHAD domain-containing protein